MSNSSKLSSNLLPPLLKTRFAPSPTGHLHLGHIFALLACQSIAKKLSAKIYLRFEDHDRQRCREEYVQSNLEAIYSIFPESMWDTQADFGKPYLLQSQRENRYRECQKTLEDLGLLYACACSRKKIISMQKQGNADYIQDELFYPGTCRDLRLPYSESTSLRFKLGNESITFNDGCQGTIHQQPCRQCGDFQIKDRKGNWTYQYCNVIDDFDQGINLIIRGKDILSSTGRQLLLRRALFFHDRKSEKQSEKQSSLRRDFHELKYYHHGLIFDSAGEKLSKRQQAFDVRQLFKSKTPEQVALQACHAAGLLKDITTCSLGEILHHLGNAILR